MREETIRSLLEEVAAGRLTPEQALSSMRRLPFEDIGFAKIDHHRALRCGAPEVIFCQGKTPEQVAGIACRILEAGSDLLATRADAAHYEAVRAARPDAVYHEAARCITVRLSKAAPIGRVMVLTAGTSDLPVAGEAYREDLERANVLVVVAGMEGALASVVGGLVARPVIAVPTSVGYGASFAGVAPLLTMLNSCAAGVVVVNIDNGFGAGYMAGMINSMACPNNAGPRERGQA
jgi:pyridinium-3,5-biscarboxylic acid mononucleotide synthase